MKPAPDFTPVFNSASAAWQGFAALLAVGPYYKIFRHLHVIGRENVPKDKPFIVVSNHLSNFDPPIMRLAINRPICFVAKKELFENRNLARLITSLGAIYIDREKPSHSSIKKIREAIRAGWCVSIFIEGTRSKIPGFLGTAHTGAAYFAFSNKIPILPIGLVDTNIKNGHCYAKIGSLIEPTKDLEVTTQNIMKALSGLTGCKLPETVREPAG